MEGHRTRRQADESERAADFAADLRLRAARKGAPATGVAGLEAVSGEKFYRRGAEYAEIRRFRCIFELCELGVSAVQISLPLARHPERFNPGGQSRIRLDSR